MECKTKGLPQKLKLEKENYRSAEIDIARKQKEIDSLYSSLTRLEQELSIETIRCNALEKKNCDLTNRYESQQVTIMRAYTQARTFVPSVVQPCLVFEQQSALSEV